MGQIYGDQGPMDHIMMDLKLKAGDQGVYYIGESDIYYEFGTALVAPRFKCHDCLDRLMTMQEVAIVLGGTNDDVSATSDLDEVTIHWIGDLGIECLDLYHVEDVKRLFEAGGLNHVWQPVPKKEG
ncbi:hypothetical protein GQF42_15985 [Streptomyces broussonetiae]|uniref:Uncharacterized protein n=1 Tax=Streptomyces broussonetiae TaxID=2686304 RepID=A0A6I6N3H2_9ACTN|nr:hypothetical protein [Streptomyces broussonetiae]QHA04590.1 hypothetical protein GQF42_15985 [Streptomyces broussonetiae]